MAARFDLATLVGHIEPLKHRANAIIYSTDSSGNTISVEEAIDNLQSDFVMAEHPSLATQICELGLVLGQFVYIDGTTLRPALSDDISTADTIGVVVDIDSAGTPCVIKATGGVNYYAGLTAGVRYFLSETVPGGLQTTVPTTAGHIIKMVGTAINGTTLMIDTTQPLIIRS